MIDDVPKLLLACTLAVLALLALAWTLAVSGGSRVILYAHWPSDVAASLALGALWLVMLPALVGEPRWPSADATLHVAPAPPR